METAGYGGGGYSRRGKKGSCGGRRGERRPPRGGGRWFHHQPQPEWGRSWSGEEPQRGRYGGGQGFHNLLQPQRGQSGTVSQPWSGHRKEGAEIGGRGGGGGGLPRGGGRGFYHQPQPERQGSWSYEETRRGGYGGRRGFNQLAQPWRGQSGTVSYPRPVHRREGAEIGGRRGEGGGLPRGGGGGFQCQPQPRRRRSWSGDERRRVGYGFGRGFHHLAQPKRGQSGTVCQPRSGHKGEGAEIGGRGREKEGGRAHGGGSSIWPPTGSDHPHPLPSDPVLELGRPQDRQRSASSCMLEAKDKIPVHQPDREGILALETNRVQVKLKPEGVTAHCNIDPKYRSLWRRVIDIAGWACEALNWGKYLMLLFSVIEFVRESK